MKKIEMQHEGSFLRKILTFVDFVFDFVLYTVFPRFSKRVPNSSPVIFPIFIIRFYLNNIFGRSVFIQISF